MGPAAPPPRSPPLLSLPLSCPLHQLAFSLSVGWGKRGAQRCGSRCRLSPPAAAAGTSEGAPAERPAVQTPLMPTQLPPLATHSPGTNLPTLPKPAAKAAVERAFRALPRAVSVLGCAGWRRCYKLNANYPKDPPSRIVRCHFLSWPQVWGLELWFAPAAPPAATHYVLPPFLLLW